MKITAMFSYSTLNKLITYIALFSFFACIVQFSHLSAKTAPESFADVIEELSPSVVNITTTTVIKGRANDNLIVPRGSPLEKFFNQPDGDNRPNRRGTALGSGFIISDDGIVVTNNHVIENADQIKVEMFDGSILSAELSKSELRFYRKKFKKYLNADDYIKRRCCRDFDVKLWFREIFKI